MIHHLSIPAENPEHVATVLAEILDGRATTLMPDTGTWAAWSKDDYGTTVEVFPYGFVMTPGKDEAPVDMGGEPAKPGYTETHAAISVNLTTEELIAIAEREGWRAIELSRGAFRVIEFWIENRVMLELLTEDMTEE